MSNYRVAREEASLLLLVEKPARRVLFGLFFLGFGSVCLWLLVRSGTYDGGGLLAAVIAAVSILVGIASIVRTGRIRVDGASGSIEFSGGIRKLRARSRSLSFAEVRCVSVKRTSGHGPVSYAVRLEVDRAPDVVLDQMNGAARALALAELVARHIGCRLESDAL